MNVNEGFDKVPTVDEIKDMLQEKRALPLGLKEFEEFFERLWSGALLTSEPGKEEWLKLSAKNVIANEILHLPSSQTHETDIYFINRLRKVATNQVCISIVDQTKAAIMKLKESELENVKS